MSGRKAYLDWVEDEYCLIPKDFPDFMQLNGIECYDYYKVNQWFNKDGYVFKLTWEECQEIIDAFDEHSTIATKLSEQLLQYAVTFVSKIGEEKET